MGTGSFNLADLKGEKDDVWIKLEGVASGEIHLQLSIRKQSDEEDEI
jgi:hypothetical protein